MRIPSPPRARSRGADLSVPPPPPPKASHEFINFTNAPSSTPEDAGEDQVAKATAHRMQFEQVERDFVSGRGPEVDFVHYSDMPVSKIRFFRRILAPYNAQTPLAKPPFATASTSTRTYLVTLPFPDLTPYVPSLHVLCTGASAIELRADLLSDPHPHPRPGVAEEYENPSLSYISEQFALLRRHAPDLPIVFTLRTPAQGGKYPYPSGANEAGMFATLHHALKLGADLIDIEQGLDPVRTAQVVADAKQRQTTVIISWRDVVGPASGGFSWDGPHATARYSAAVAMGADVVKIVGTASDVQDNFLLRVFAFSDLVKTGPPLSAYNMGPYGRLSRFLNPLLASVTHPVARKGTVRGVIGAPSMTFREVQMALHLSGLLSTRHFIPFARGEEVGSRPVLRELCVRGFDDLGLPFDLLDPDWTTVGPETSFKDALAFYRGEPFFAGGSVGEENGVEAMGEMDEVTEVAQSVGGIDAFIVLPPTGTGPPNLKGECVTSFLVCSQHLDYDSAYSHVYTRALVNVLGARLSPSNAVSPASFALVLSPTFADLSISSTSPFSISSHLPSTSHCNSLHVRSIFSALSSLGIRQVAVVDPALASLEELAAKRPTIIVSLGDGNELSPHQVESLLASPTGGSSFPPFSLPSPHSIPLSDSHPFFVGVVMSLAPHFSSPPPNPSRQPNATNTLLDVAREPSRARRGWIAVSSEAVEEEFASAVFKFWTERTCPPSSVL